MFKTAITILSGLLLAYVPADAAQYGYCTSDVSRSNIFRVGSTERQGLAIMLGPDKIDMLKGQTITTVSAAFGSRNTNDGNATIFITKSLEGSPVVEQTFKISSPTKWLDFTLNAPYTITGDEEALYIGYTTDINTKSSVLMADHTNDAASVSRIYYDGEWIDTYGLGCGLPSIRFATDADSQSTDLVLKPLSLDGYFKANEPYSQKGQIFNFGTETVSSFDVSVSIEGQAPVTLQYNGLQLVQGQTFDISLPEFSADAEGPKAVSVEVINVNAGADQAAADNVYASQTFFYPAAMERSILLEGFTGQECSNCPSGHSIINKFIESATTPIIEVMHHAGYNPDFMTMKEDADYTFFYGAGNTFAPAVMLNRTQISTIGTCPVMNVSTNNLQTAYTVIEQSHPYVSLSIESDFNKDTRQATVRVNTLTHTDMPAENNVLNIALVQNGIVSLQVPYGMTYVHNGVFRGTLTGNSWGLMLDEASCKALGQAAWETTFTLPQAIFSNYWNYDAMDEADRELYSIATDPDNMYLVAYVGAYAQGEINRQPIYNAVAAPLGASYTQGGITSIRDIETDETQPITITVDNGHIYVNGSYDHIDVYNIDGMAADPNHQLAKGLYIVRVAAGTKTLVKKILIK